MVSARLLGSEAPRPAVTDATAVRRRLLSAHRPALERALACADAVAARWDGDSTTDSVADEYRAALEAAGVLDPLVAALADAVDHAGGELAARPVADAPYLAVAGRGWCCGDRWPTAAGSSLRCGPSRSTPTAAGPTCRRRSSSRPSAGDGPPTRVPRRCSDKTVQ